MASILGTFIIHAVVQFHHQGQFQDLNCNTLITDSCHKRPNSLVHDSCRSTSAYCSRFGNYSLLFVRVHFGQDQGQWGQEWVRYYSLSNPSLVETFQPQYLATALCDSRQAYCDTLLQKMLEVVSGGEHRNLSLLLCHNIFYISVSQDFFLPFHSTKWSGRLHQQQLRLLSKTIVNQKLWLVQQSDVVL